MIKKTSQDTVKVFIKTLNDGRLDKSYQINWNDYQNSLLLTGKYQKVEFHTLFSPISNFI